MLAITGGKGGTGKTTTALGIGAALARRRRNPVIVEADVDMPNLHIRAGTPEGGLQTLADGASVDSVAVESSEFSGIDIIGGTPGAPLNRALRSLSTDRPVILDGAAGVSERAVTPLRHADRAVFVTSDTPAAVTDTAKTLRIASRIGTPVAGFLVSRTSDVSDDITSQLPAQEILAIPPSKQPVTSQPARSAYSRIIDIWRNV